DGGDREAQPREAGAATRRRGERARLAGGTRGRHSQRQGRERAGRVRRRHGQGRPRRPADLLPVPVGRSRRQLQALPASKDGEGLEGPQTAFDRADENVYYEDKLSAYFTDVPNGSCAATCHLGVGPHAAKGEKHGVHYTNGEVGDVWHWKAVRTNPMGIATGEPGFMDDQHVRGPDPIPARLTPDPLHMGGDSA